MLIFTQIIISELPYLKANFYSISLPLFSRVLYCKVTFLTINTLQIWYKAHAFYLRTTWKLIFYSFHFSNLNSIMISIFSWLSFSFYKRSSRPVNRLRPVDTFSPNKRGSSRQTTRNYSYLCIWFVFLCRKLEINNFLSNRETKRRSSIGRRMTLTRLYPHKTLRNSQKKNSLGHAEVDRHNKFWLTRDVFI